MNDFSTDFIKNVNNFDYICYVKQWDRNKTLLKKI